MAFNLDNYEDVNARITRFRAEYPMGRLEAYIEDIDFVNGRILVKALAFRTDDPNELPAAIDYAYEAQSTHGVNRDFWVENAITSAYGRVIGALSPSGARPTRQDMEKAEKLQSAPPKPVDGFMTAAESIAQLKEKLGAKIQSEAPTCNHGHRLKVEGISSKTNRPYLGWKCPERVKARQCEMVWWKQTPDGKDWVSPADYQDYQQDHHADATMERREKEPPPIEMMSESEKSGL